MELGQPEAAYKFANRNVPRLRELANRGAH